MTTDLKDTSPNFELLNENLSRIEELSQRLVSALAKQKETRASLQAPGPDLYTKTAAAYWTDAMTNPAKVIGNQVEFWGKSLSHFIDAQQKLVEGAFEAPEDKTPADRRFKDPLWDNHPYFNFVKQQYLMTSDAITGALDNLDDLDASDQKRASYFARQMIDMFSPTNFLGTNPEALMHAVETNGQSLVDGLENLVEDLERSDGELMVRGPIVMLGYSLVALAGADIIDIAEESYH